MRERRWESEVSRRFRSRVAVLAPLAADAASRRGCERRDGAFARRPDESLVVCNFLKLRAIQYARGSYGNVNREAQRDLDLAFDLATRGAYNRPLLSRHERKEKSRTRIGEPDRRKERKRKTLASRSSFLSVTTARHA